MTSPTMMTTTTTVPSPSNGVYIMEVKPATVETGEKKGGPSSVSAMLMYDDMEVVKCPKKKDRRV